METGNFWFAFGLTLFAGLSTGIGSALAFFTKSTSTRFLSLSLGFSAGVMIYVSFVEIFVKAKHELVTSLGEVAGTWATVGAFFGGIALIEMPMQLTPEVETPTITIETTWPGASPQEVEREIVQEQEEQLKGVEGLKKLSGECMDSMGRLTLEFKVGTDMSEALLKVNTRLAQVPDYPLEAKEPVLSTANSSNQPIAWFILRARVPDREAFVEF